jgi:hypothetical protein
MGQKTLFGANIIGQPSALMNHLVFSVFWMFAGTSLPLIVWLIGGEASQALESALSLISIAVVPLIIGGFQYLFRARISGGELLSGAPFQIFVFLYNIAAISVLGVMLWFSYSQYDSNESFNPLLNLDWNLRLTWTKPISSEIGTENPNPGANDVTDINSDRRDIRPDTSGTKISEWKIKHTTE